jgi:hypothetical protein
MPGTDSLLGWCLNPGWANGGAGASPSRHTTSAAPFAPNKRPPLEAAPVSLYSRGVSGFFTGPIAGDSRNFWPNRGFPIPCDHKGVGNIYTHGRASRSA